MLNDHLFLSVSIDLLFFRFYSWIFNSLRQVKFKKELHDKDFIRSLTHTYAEGLQWVLKYYYQGTFPSLF
jgi:5'-3' exonuclease